MTRTAAPTARPGAAPDVAELARLEALARFGVLDTGPEAAFDDLTALAARLMAAPIALVSLVDSDRQWFKSRLGMKACQTPRERSFCDHALRGPNLMVVPDATLDPRFADNPLVAGEAGIRFYAGAPLVTADGFILGTLCVLDVVPRALATSQQDDLVMLARQVMNLLELGRQAAELAREIGARAATEAALRDSQRLLQGVLEHTDAVITVKDEDGRYLLGNPAHARMVGCEPDAVLGRSDYDLFPAPAADRYREHDLEVMASGRKAVFAEEAPHLDGSVHGYLSTRFPLRNEAGRIYAIAGVSTDVTELAEARREHAESEQRWKALVEHSPVSVAVLAADGTFVYANPRALLLYGARSQDLLGRSAADFIPDGDAAQAAELFRGLLEGGPALEAYRWTLQPLTGPTLAVEIHAALVTYNAKPALQVELRDVSAQAAAETAMRDSERRFRTLFASSPVGAAECLPDGTIVAVNARLGDMLGYSTDELAGLSIRTLLHDPADAAGQQRDVDALEQTSRFFRERTYRRKDGSPLCVLVGAAAVRDEQGRVHRNLGTVVDISQQVEVRDALQAAQADLEARRAFTDAVLDSIDVGIVACDAAGRLTLFNDAAQRWHGTDLAASPEAADDTSAFAVAFTLHGSDGELLAPGEVPLLRALNDGSVRNAEMLIRPHDKAAVRVTCTGRALSAPDGQPLGAVVAMTDVTAARAQTRALEASELRFRTTFVNDPAGLAVLTPHGRVLQVNPALGRLLGRGEDELLSVPDLTDSTFWPQRPELVSLVEAAMERDGASIAAELELLRADGAALWTLVTATRLPDADEHPSLLLQVEDITARRSAEQSLAHQATHDALTGLPNRAMLLDRASQALARLRRDPDGLVALLFLDLDGFKAVNDTHGHGAGDALLTELARRLERVMRPTDTVARLGGDEFVVLCEHLPDPQEAARIARRLERAVEVPVLWREEQLVVGVSVGIAYGSPEQQADDLVRDADQAMYRAKRLLRG